LRGLIILKKMLPFKDSELPSSNRKCLNWK
jgi:hypothetical protein